MKKTLLLDENPFTDDWLFTNINKLINQINQQDTQITTEQLKQHKITESDTQIIIDELKQVISQNSLNQLYQNIFYRFFLFRLLKLFFYCFLNDSFTILNLIMLNYTTDFIQDFNGSNIYKPAISLFIMVVIQLSKTFFISNKMQQSNVMIVRIKVILQYLIFTKTQKTLCVGLRSSESADYIANVNTLLTDDIDEISNSQFALNQILTNLILIGGSFGYLFYIDSQATWMVILVIFIAQVCNLFVNKMILFFEKRLLKNKDDRVSLTTDVIEGIKQIKYLSWENAFSKKIMDVRKKEFRNLVGLKVLDGLQTIFWNNISYILLLIFITNLLSRGIKFADVNIFTLIALFNTINFPLGILQWSFNQILVSKVSFDRIHEYLNQKEIQKLNMFQLPYQADNQNAIIIQDIAFKWPQGKDSDEIQNQSKNYTQVRDYQQDSKNLFQLQINDFKVKNNTINFIIGKIGSGKTALINALLNEMTQNDQIDNIHSNKLSDSIQSQSAERLMSINGKVDINGRIGYCSQTTWVQNQSIRQNICFGKLYEQDLFDICVNVCELNRDIESFPKKDLHEVGPDGKNLSGGQKQRITLARALYQDADIYLFDDIFSSLDIHIADRIFQNAFINYLLNRGKTIIFITSHYRYLDQAPASIQSKVFLMENGNIIDEEQTVKEFITQNQSEKEDSLGETDYQSLPLLKNSPSIKIDNIITIQEQNNDLEDSNDDNEESREQGEISIKTWISWFSKMNWALLILYFVFGIITQLATSVIDFWLRAQLTQQKNWITQFTDKLSSDFSYALFYLTLISLAIHLCHSVLYVISGLNAAWKFFQELNQSIMFSLMSFFDVTNQGRIINRVQNDTHIFDNALSWSFDVLKENVSKIIVLSIGLAIIFPILTLIIVLVIILYLKMRQTYSKSNRELKRLYLVNQGKLISILNEFVTGVKIIRAFQKEDYFEQTYLNRLSDLILLNQCSERSNYWFKTRLVLLSNMIMLFLVLLICFLMQFQFNIEFSQCALALTYCLISLDCCSELFEFYVQTEQLMVSVERINQYLDNKQENLVKIKNDSQEFDQTNESDIFKQNNQITKKLDDEAVIQFLNVFMTYNEQFDEASKWALKDINFSIKKGEKVAFVGKTGSGKTSILNVLFRLYEYQYGQITINRQDIKYISLLELRQQMSVVPQFGFLYNANIKDNLDPENKNTQEEIEQLFIKIGFKFRGISEQQQNTCFMVQPNGSNLSNGEKQIINFIRIILQDKQIVCLDEATSNMDPNTDQLLHKLLFKYVEDKTLIVITHRLENISKYDKIIVMDQGQIVEMGSYDQLNGIPDGFFHKLILHQNK